MTEILLSLPLFLGQDISHKLSPKQPPEIALPASAAQDTSLFQCGSLSKTSGTCLSQSYSETQQLLFTAVKLLKWRLLKCVVTVYWRRVHFHPISWRLCSHVGTLTHASGWYSQNPSQQSRKCHLQRLLSGKHTKAESLMSLLYLADPNW